MNRTDGSRSVDYGVDASGALRNIALAGAACLLLAFFGPPRLHFGTDSFFDLHKTTLITGCVLTVESALWLLYVKYGKFKHRDMMLALSAWRGDEQVLDVGCGRGLLLIGAAKLLSTGHCTGIDIWSNEDLSNNAEANTLANMTLEGVADRCTLVSTPAQSMPFADGTFDVVVSNLCLHNIPDKTTRAAALDQVVRVLKPGGVALISDFKKTGEYAAHFRAAGLVVTKKRGRFITTFPPLTVVIARKPL